MVLTEDDLAPYRDGRGLAHLFPVPDVFERYATSLPAYAQRVAVPDKLLTPTHKILKADWHTPEDANACRDRLQAIPVLAFRTIVPVLSPALTWYGFIHQCAGFYCYQMRMIATRLQPKPAITAALNAIVRHYYDADGGLLSHDNLRASQIVSYVETLGHLGLTCEMSWKSLHEAAYPIDATQENLDLVAEGAPPLSEMADWYDEPSAMRSSCSLPGTAIEASVVHLKHDVTGCARPRPELSGQQKSPAEPGFENAKEAFD